ncbi:FKBP-type peptidyl-prolyl cis-trans isomerase [Chitinophaga pollutisoli]|uniref:Peptidyl-prolyl cis-trans isomerase n=1 Tax=Chitinophaga pollutisoli TaxID=3133966 RepID=A0ABZ2YMB7_9BACT
MPLNKGLRLFRSLPPSLGLLVLAVGLLTGCAKSLEDADRILSDIVAETNAIRGYLKQHKMDSGTVIHPSGMIYRIWEPGDKSDTISLDEIPVVTYKRKLLGQDQIVEASPIPTSFDNRRLKDHILGWQYGLPLITKGGRIELFIPSRLAFSDVGIPGKIPPNAILHCDITLIDIRK